MDADLTRTCEMFIRNRELLSDTFRWEGSAMHLIGSAVLTAHDLEPGIETLTRMATIIRENAGMLSPLRGYLKIMMVCNMMLSDDPDEYYHNVERAYNLIRITRRKKDPQYYLAAIAMCNAVKHKDELLEVTDRANEIYGRLKSECGDGNSEKGFVLAAAIAATGARDTDAYFEEVYKCRSLLEDVSGSSCNVFELCCILALDKAAAQFKCARLREIFRLMESEGMRTAEGSELPVLGTLAMLDMTNDEIAGALKEADAYLRGCKGFGMFGCGPDKRHMYAALLVMCTYSSVTLVEQMASSSVLADAVTSQFAAMAASTMIVTSAVYEALDTDPRLF